MLMSRQCLKTHPDSRWVEIADLPFEEVSDPGQLNLANAAEFPLRSKRFRSLRTSVDTIVDSYVTLSGSEAGELESVTIQF
jgi:hypothetical protein